MPLEPDRLIESLSGINAAFDGLARQGVVTAREVRRLGGSLREALYAIHALRRSRGWRRHVRRQKAAAFGRG